MRLNSDAALDGNLQNRTRVHTLLAGGAGSRELLHAMMLEPACQVEGVSSRPGELPREIRKSSVEVAIIDLSVELPDLPAYLAKLRKTFPNLGILALSEDVRPGTIEDAIRAGANGFLVYSELEGQLADALSYVRQGEIYVGSQNRGRLLEFLLVLSGMSDSGLEARLSARELQVFKAIGRGRSLREIAGKLGLKHKTIETYRDRIKEKLRLRDSTQLMHYAVRWVARQPGLDS